DRNRREDRGEQQDQHHCAGKEILQIAHATSLDACIERMSDARSKQKPEHQGRSKSADDAAALSNETQKLPLPEHGSAGEKSIHNELFLAPLLVRRGDRATRGRGG